MKYMSESLGIDFEPDYSSSTDLMTSDDDASGVATFDEKEATNFKDLNEVIHKTKNYGLSLMESADSYELHQHARIYEVANQLLGTALAGIKTKHAYEFKAKEISMKASRTASPANIGNTQINNFFGTREELMEQMQRLMEDKNEDA